MANPDLALDADYSGPTDMAFKRDSALLVPERLMAAALEFQTAMDTYMQDDGYRLLEYADHRGVRLNRYIEEQDLVYSVIHAGSRQDKPMPPGVFQATSIIAAEDGRTYGERHWFKNWAHIDTPEKGLGCLATAQVGIMHPLRTLEWHQQILPITRALTVGRGLLKVVS